jgi:SAM-dependent methyltransferase
MLARYKLFMNQCPLCSSSNTRKLYSTCDRHYGIPGGFVTAQCAECQLVFLNPLPSDAELSALYPANYYAYQPQGGIPGWKKMLKRMLLYEIRTLDPSFPSPGVMLDVGCGSGWFLQDMKQAGWVCHGVEISHQGAAIARAAGLDVKTGTLETVQYPTHFFDYVRSNHSFEHMTNPREVLREIHRILKPSGKLMIGVPRFDSLNARLFGPYWWYLGVPVHPFNYSRKNLRRLLEEAGFDVEKVSLNSDYSGILGSIQIWLNRANGRLSTEGLIFNLTPLRLTANWLAKLLDLLGVGDAMEIIAVPRRIA